MKPIEITIPIKASASLNSRMHWAERAKVVKRERAATALAWRRTRPNLSPLVRVTLTRFGPRDLDSDNLAGVLKSTRDQIAAELRIDDGSPLIAWEYRQERGDYAVRVELHALQPVGSPPLEPPEE